MANGVKEKLRQGSVCYGAWIEWTDPSIVELFGYLGFEYAMMDAEHGPLDPTTCAGLIRGCDAVGMVPIVRVPKNDPSVILSYLELGAKGIYVPHVNSAAEAEAIVAAVKYAPEGHRGAGSWRAVQYGVVDPPLEYVKRANEETMIIALVEETEGVRNLDEILAVEGVDVVGIGDGDLSHTLGHPGERAHPDVRRVVDDAEGRIAASSKALDAVVSDAEEARVALGRGCTMISFAVRRALADTGRGFLAGVDHNRR